MKAKNNSCRFQVREYEELCRHQGLWRDAGHQADGHEDLTRHNDLLHRYFPTATASKMAYGCFVVMHWVGTDCILRESGSPEWGWLNCWRLRSHQPHYFLKLYKCAKGLSCAETLICSTSKHRSHIRSVKSLQEETERGATHGRSQLRLGRQWQAWIVSDLLVLSPVRRPLCLHGNKVLLSLTSPGNCMFCFG